MTRTTHRFRRFCARTVGLLMALIGLMALTAVPASAHHPEISASAVCPATVNWTAVAWAGTTSASRTNSDIRVYKKIGSAARVQVGSGQFNAGNGYTFSGSFALTDPVPATVQVIVRANAAWANGAAAGDERSVTVTMPTNCTPPAVIAPKASIDGSCTTVAVVLNNADSNQPVTFTVTTPAGATETHAVAAGASKNLSYPAVDGATVEVKNGAASLAKKVLDCPVIDPVASITPDCTEVSVLLDNSGSNRPTVFAVTKANGTSVNHTVAAGATETVTFAAVDGGTVEVTVDGQSLAKVVLDCPVAAPVSTITPDCAEVSVLLDNTGSNRPVDFVVTSPTGAVATVNVGGGQTKTVSYAAVDGATVTVTVGNQTLATQTLDCPVAAPAATITPDCTTVTVLLDNTGSNRPVDYAVTTPSGAVETVNVLAGQSRTVEYVAVPNAVISVTADGLATPVTGTVGACVDPEDPPIGTEGGVTTGGPITGIGSGVSRDLDRVVTGHVIEQDTSGLPGTGSHLPIGMLVLGSGLISAGALVTRRANRFGTCASG